MTRSSWTKWRGRAIVKPARPSRQPSSRMKPARLLRDSRMRWRAFEYKLRVEGAAKSLIFQTPFPTSQATNQGVVGSNPASRAN